MKTIVILLCVTCFFHIISTNNDVRLPPIIRRWPENYINKIYKMYDNVTLECKAEGKPDVRYEWKKNGLQLDTNLLNIQKGSDGTITIKRATENDEGYFQCFAHNQYGTALSDMISIRMAFMDLPPRIPAILQQTVVEGTPFHIPANRQRSFPEPENMWARLRSIFVDTRTHIHPSERMQFAENGDLYFAYALPNDTDGDERIYWSHSRNPFLDGSKWGSPTQLTVTRNPKGIISGFAPSLAFSSPAQTVALIGRRVTFRCFFYGYPTPKISWSLPQSAIQSGRIQRYEHDTERTIRRVTASDAGECSCSGSNTQGNTTHTFQIRVEDVPRIQNAMDGPYDINVTEGESVTFNCNATAIPEAKIVWLQNGYAINADNPPKRFAFSNDRKSLTIRDVCRDCVDPERKTDLMVIQCNASNVHGYAFAQGYLNVLSKTKVTMMASKTIFIDFQEERHMVFNCYVTSDPSTHPIVRWYKTEPFDNLVRNEPPYIRVTNVSLSILIDPRCSAECVRYLGEYRCVGDNGYSRDNQTITLIYQPLTELPTHKEEPLALWKIILVLGAVFIFLLLVGICLKLRLKRSSCCANRRLKKRRLPSIHDDGGYDSIGFHLEELAADKERCLTRVDSMYEHIGQDSIETQHQVHTYEATRVEPGIFTKHNVESTSANACTNLIRKEVNHNMDLDKSKSDTKEAISRVDLRANSKEMNEYLEPRDLKQYMHQVSKEASQNADLSPKEEREYKGLSPKNMDLSPTEVNQSIDLGPKEVIRGKVDLDPKKVDQNSDPCAKELNQGIGLGPKEVKQRFYLGPKENNRHLSLPSGKVSK